MDQNEHGDGVDTVVVSGYPSNNPPIAKGSDPDDSGGGAGNAASTHKSGLGGPNNAANANKDWSSRFRRRRKDDEVGSGGSGSGSGGGGSGSARSSNSSVSANTTGNNKIASPNQTRNESASSSGNQVAGGRGSQQSHQAQSVQSPPQQHFDLEASSFPPLPIPDQSTNLVVSQTATVHNLKNNGGIGNVADSVASGDAVAKATPVGTASAWGENRLADVVKGTAKTAKSTKNAAASDKETIVTGSAVTDDIPIVSASSKAPTSQINQQATASSTPSNASKSKTVESGDEANVITMAKPSSQRHDSLYAQHQAPRIEQQQQHQLPPPQQQQQQQPQPPPSNLANNTDVTATAAAAVDPAIRSSAAPHTTPPTTFTSDMSNMIPHPNTKNNPVIKHLNAEISTKTDGSLVNGIDDNSGIHALTNSTENLSATGGNTNVARNSSTRNAATMTIGTTTEVTVSSTPSAASTISTTPTQTAFVSKSISKHPLAGFSSPSGGFVSLTNEPVSKTTSVAKSAQSNAAGGAQQKMNINVSNSSQTSSVTMVSPTSIGVQPQLPAAQQSVAAVAAATASTKSAGRPIQVSCDNSVTTGECAMTMSGQPISSLCCR